MSDVSLTLSRDQCGSLMAVLSAELSRSVDIRDCLRDINAPQEYWERYCCELSALSSLLAAASRGCE